MVWRGRLCGYLRREDGEVEVLVIGVNSLHLFVGPET